MSLVIFCLTKQDFECNQVKEGSTLLGMRFEEGLSAFFFFNFTPEDIFIDFRERKGAGMRERRERDIDVRKKHQLIACYTHSNWGLNPQPFGV